MQISMKNIEKLTLSEMKDFLSGSRQIEWKVDTIEEKYRLIDGVLCRHKYSKLGRKERGTVRTFLEKVTSTSTSQMTRLIGRWQQDRTIKRKPVKRPRFPYLFRQVDVILLASTDVAHQDLSGPAVCRILKREYEVFGNQCYQRLSGISVSHLYNLRKSPAYLKQRVRIEPTRGTPVSIAERRKPDPKGKPGYIRVDTVHQGNKDGKHGLYHINAVDTVTQWQVVGCVEAISEQHLLPVLEAMLHQFPFRILGFHCDNGSEFINYQVAGMLEKLFIEFTKSRAYRTTDNALVEGKNGAVVRKHIGYGFIASEHAEQVQKFFTAYFNPYLNFHRPCGFATLREGARGRIRRIYKAEDYRTPFEKLSSLDKWMQYLKPGLTCQLLTAQATRMSDTEAAKAMQKAKNEILKRVRLPW